MNNPTLKERLAKLPPEKRKQLLAELERRKQKQKNSQAPPPLTPRLNGAPQRPASFAQRRLWFLDQFTPASSAYNIPVALRLDGALDQAALGLALNTILSRHHVLHQIYATEGDEPILVPHPDPTLYLTPQPISPADLQSAINTFSAQPFDLAQDLPIRAKLLCLTNTQHILLITLHHIASDGWSMSVFFNELSQLYNHFIANQKVPPFKKGGTSPANLSDLPIQYADYAHWQRDWLSGDVLDKELGYWLDQLDGAETTLDLPTDHPRPGTRTFSGSIHPFQLTPHLSQAIEQSARQANVTLYMYLLTAFQILLHRYTAKTDILIGSPVAGRTQPETEPLIGLFLNTLVIRANLADNPTVAQLLKQTQRTTLDAFEHQHVPFEKLVEALQLERLLSHNPLIQVLFNVHNTPPFNLDMADLQASLIPTEVHTAKFDLNVAFAQTDDGLRGTISYSTDLFEPETIERMAGHFEQLLMGMVANPNQLVSHLPLMTEPELAWVNTWHETDKAYPPVTSMLHLFEAQAAQTPEDIAIIFEGAQLTYRQLNDHANQLARHLRDKGAGREIPIGLLLDRSLEIMVALFAVLKSGSAYIPLDPTYPPERLATILDEAQTALLITDSTLHDLVPHFPAGSIIHLDTHQPQITQHPTHNLDLDIQPTDLMYALFTSGSTGKPKGVMVEHRHYVSYFQAVFDRMDVPAGQTYAMVTTFATDLGSIMFWSALTSGGRVHIFSYERATDPQKFAAYFCQHNIDVLKIVPSHYKALCLMADMADLVPNRLLILAGEPSYWETVHLVKAVNPHCTVQDHYGATETTGIMLTYTVPHDPNASGPLPKGRPLANSHLYLLDAHRQPVPIGVPGEIFVGGQGVTRGYLNRPDLTEQVFLPDPFSDDPTARMYRTGDLATFLPDGTLKLLGRSDFQIKIRGYRVELGEIESVLKTLPGLDRCVVMAKTDDVGDAKLIAYISAEPNHSLTIDTVRQFLRERLPDYMIPAGIILLDHMPLNPNGKIDRPALASLQLSVLRPPSSVSSLPTTPTEKKIAQIWCNVLSLPQVGLDDNFFDVGGESFKAIRVVRQLGSDVSVMDLFQNPTVRQLAEHLASDTPHQSQLLYELTSPLAPAKRQYTLVCVPYGGGSAAVYHPLAQHLPDGVSLFAVDLPGHDYSRFGEAKLPLEELAAQCVTEIQQHVTGDITLYGHCVGSALAIEIARQLEAEGVSLMGVILGGNFPSPRVRQLEFFHKYLPLERWTSSRMIFEAMRGVGGFTDILDPQEQHFVIENMRYDVREASDYYTEQEHNPNAKLSAPICCVVAQEDPATEFYEERTADWLTYSDTVNLKIIPDAGHYFLKHQAEELGELIGEQAESWRNPSSNPDLPGFRNPAGLSRPSFNVFLLVAFGQLISMVGTGLTTFTLGVWALETSNSLVNFTVISIFALLPGILVSPFAGAAADRWDRRKVMIASDILAALGTAIIAWLLFTDNLQIWHIYLTASIGSVANAFQQPAYIAAIAQLVPKRHLGRANGIAQLAANTGRVLSPLLGGLLYVTFNLSTIVLFDFLTFLFAVGTLLFLRFPNTLFRKREEPFRQEILGGWHYITKRPSLVAMVVFMVVYNFFSSFATVMIAPLVLAFGDAAILGTVMSAFGLGLIGGAMAMSIWGGMRRRAEGLIIFTTLTGVSLILTGFRSNVFFLTIGLFTLGVFFALIDSHWQAIIQTKVGFALQGRVVSINQMLVWAMMPIGFFLSGVLADNLFEPLIQSGTPVAVWLGDVIGAGPGRGIALMLITIGILQIIWGGLGWATKRLRYLEDTLPDAIPTPIVTSDRDKLQKLADQELSLQTT